MRKTVAMLRGMIVALAFVSVKNPELAYKGVSYALHETYFVIDKNEHCLYFIFCQRCGSCIPYSTSKNPKPNPRLCIKRAIAEY
jgi:hypothetical protein